MRKGDSRPNADALLVRLKEQEKSPRGKLKIFLGYAAGVGKTYAMLSAARQARETGRKVLAGVVETHGRPETEALVVGCELLPRRKVEHKNVNLSEFDLEACLALHPDLVLMDELAHTNAPGSRHPKRFQDVEELLAAGIDVYTTLNIQHLESLNDVIEQITNVKVRETVPDSVLQLADALALIDLPPEELLIRLQTGNVYVGEKARVAADNFFRPGNLTALRELALRRAADRVDHDVLAYMQRRSIDGPWQVRDRLMVAVGPSPLSERLVRSAKRLAETLGAEWFAVTVDTGQPLRPDARERRGAHLRLAESLGARTFDISGPTIAEAVMNFGRKHNVTKVVAGKPLRKKWRWRGDLVDQMIRQSGDIDVYVISGDATPEPIDRPRRTFRVTPYALAALAVVCTTVVCLPIRPYLVPANLVMAYLLASAAVAFRLGRGPALLASGLGVLLFDFCFVPPYYNFGVADTEYILTFAAFLAVSFSISSLTAFAQEQATAARSREAETNALLDLSRKLSSSYGAERVGEAFAAHISQHFNLAAHFTMKQASDIPGWSSAQLAVAQLAWERGKPAGRGTDTLPQADVFCYPVPSDGEPLGMLALQLRATLDPQQRRLLEASMQQVGLALERARLSQTANETEILKATERLQSALLNSISHDLRIPLVSITGALTTLQDKTPIDASSREELLENALAEAARLNRFVGNLLQMSRLEGGALRLKLEPNDLSDVVSMTLAAFAYPVKVDIAADLPLINVDYVMIQQVLLNLLDNARKFSPPHTPIDLRASQVDSMVQVCVHDQGPGIAPAQRELVFDRFYRAPSGEHTPGSGLGLSICRGLVEAHHGLIWVADSERGALICFTLPIALGPAEAHPPPAGVRESSFA
jgi:two-component system sensor histidine kinase KdpD